MYINISNEIKRIDKYQHSQVKKPYFVGNQFYHEIQYKIGCPHMCPAAGHKCNILKEFPRDHISSACLSNPQQRKYA